MAVNFFSSSTIPTEGSLGRSARQDATRKMGVQNEMGLQLSQYGYYVTGGIDENRALARTANEIGLSSNELSWNRSVQSGDNCNEYLFQMSNGSYLNADYNNCTYKTYSERDMLASMGIDYANRPDIVTLSQAGFNFYDFVGTGLGDGIQNGFSFSGKFDNIKWGVTTYTQAELDTSYWWAPDNSYESYKSNTFLDLIKGNANQFMFANEISALSTVTDYSTWAYMMACYTDRIL